MPEQFEFGETVILQLASYYSEYDGCEGVIINTLSERSCMDLRTMEYSTSYVYGVMIQADGAPNVWALPWQLRKIDDEDEEEQSEAAAGLQLVKEDLKG